MAAKVSQVTVKVGAESNVRAGLAAATRSITAFAKNVRSRIASTVRGIARAITSPIGMITAALGAIGIGALGKQLVEMASDAQEAGSKFDAVFKDQSDTIKAWTNDFAKSLGRSRYEMQSYMATLQDTFVPAGFARERAAELSQTVTKLAVDLASFNNMADSEALDRLQGALIGNHENALKFGVIINEASLNAELLRMGIEGGTQAASEQNKMLARLNLIIKGTTDAHGDAARTSDSFANRMKALRSQVVDLATSVGQSLLPLATSVVSTASSLLDAVAPHLQGLVAMVGGAMKRVKDWIVGNWEGIVDTVVPLVVAWYHSIKAYFGMIWSAVAGVAKGIFDAVMWAVNGVLDLFGVAGDGTGRLLETMRKFLVYAEFVWKNFGNLVALSLWDAQLSIIRLINEIEHHFTVRTPAILNWLLDNWKDIFKTIANFTTTVFDNILENAAMVGKNLWNLIRGEETDWEWKSLTEGFESEIKKWPEIAARVKSDTEKALEADIAALQQHLGESLHDLTEKRLNEGKAAAEKIKSIFRRSGGSSVPDAGPSGPELQGPGANAPGVTDQKQKSKSSRQREKVSVEVQLPQGETDRFGTGLLAAFREQFMGRQDPAKDTAKNTASIQARMAELVDLTKRLVDQPKQAITEIASHLRGNFNPKVAMAGVSAGMPGLGMAAAFLPDIRLPTPAAASIAQQRVSREPVEADGDAGSGAESTLARIEKILLSRQKEDQAISKHIKEIRDEFVDETQPIRVFRLRKQ